MNTKITYYASRPLRGGSPTAVFRFYEACDKSPERYVSGPGWVEDKRLITKLASGDLGPGDVISDKDADLIISELNKRVPRDRILRNGEIGHIQRREMNRRDEQRAKLDQSFAFLRSIGFRGPDINVSVSKLIGESLLFRYQDPIRNRQINIAYSEGSEKSFRSIVIAIVAGNRSFLLGDFLQSIGKPELKMPFAVPRSAMSEAEFIDSAAAAFQKITDDSLAQTLKGLEWPPVNFDWKGMGM